MSGLVSRFEFLPLLCGKEYKEPTPQIRKITNMMGGSNPVTPRLVCMIETDKYFIEISSDVDETRVDRIRGCTVIYKDGTPTGLNKGGFYTERELFDYARSLT